MQTPNFQLFQSLNKVASTEIESGDWSAALIVAFDILRIQTETSKKYKKIRIIIFTDFKGKPNKDHYDEILKSVNEEKASIVFISDLIKKEETQSKIHSHLLETRNQKMNAELISKLYKETNCILCDYKTSLFEVINSKNSAPWMWHCTLSIGSKISINVSGFIAAKKEFKLDLKTQSTVPDMQVINNTKYFKNIEEIFPAQEDLIKGYMLGSTPIAMDEELESKNSKTKKGLQCLFFTKENGLSRKCFNGNGTYSILPKKFSKQSTGIFNSLVHYLNKTNIAMVAKKVYRDNTNPKIVALLPRIINNVAQFVMIELFFSNQFIDMHFPKLGSKAFESNELELKTVENFINSKIISNDFDLKNIPNLSMNFSINFLSNNVNGFEVLDKNCYLSEKENSSSAEIIQEMKKLFILESRKKLEVSKKREEPEEFSLNLNQEATKSDYNRIRQVGTVTPSDDFLFLVARDVSQLNDVGLQKESFYKYVEQIQNVIERLLFKSISIQTEKIVLALETYKKEAESYDAEGFNSWMINLKTQIQSRKMFDFWENFIIKNSIGLISNDSDQLNFFSIPKVTVEPMDENDNRNVDDMFDEM
ncbi:XRCC5 family protein [Megaselia abdita]